MLSISAMSAGGAGYYVSLAADEGPESEREQGRWFGKGAAKLGLPVAVQETAFERLFAGLSPTGDPLVQLQNYTDGRSRQPGWDLTFSAPKSLSVLWSQVGPEHQAVLVRAHQEAVAEALRYLEAEAAFTRRGAGGAQVERCGLVAALFDHSTSRGDDPQLHTHALVLNVALRDDGTFGALRSFDLYEQKMAAGALYRAELAGRLVELGLQVEPVETWFEVKGVPKPLCEALSSRRESIEGALQELGLHGPRASEFAALSTRQAKSSLTADELQSAWREAAAVHGFDATSLASTMLLEPAALSVAAPSKNPAREVMAAALEPLEEAATYKTHELVRGVAQRLQDGSSPPGSIREALKGLQAAHAEAAFGERRTPLQRGIEEDLMSAIAAANETPARAVPESRVAGAMKNAVKEGLSAEQCEALASLLTGPQHLRGVVGGVGSGKTEVVKVAEEAWSASGFRVVALAPDGRAASEFQRQTGLTTQSLSKFERVMNATWGDAMKHHLTQLGRAAMGWTTYGFERMKLDERSVVVLEGAEKLQPHQLGRLVDYCSKAKAQLVLVGDGEKPTAFQCVAEHLNWKSLSTNQRTQPEWLREAISELRRGEVVAGLSHFQAEDRLVVGQGPEATRKALIEQWAREPHQGQQGRPRVLFEASKEATAKLNTELQEARREAGELSPFRRFVAHGDSFYQGDAVQLTRTQRNLGIQAGDLATIKHVAATPLPWFATVTLQLERTGKEVTITPHSFPHLQLAYALNGREVTGLECKRAFVLQSGVDKPVSTNLLAHAKDDATLFVATSVREEPPREPPRHSHSMHMGQ